MRSRVTSMISRRWSDSQRSSFVAGAVFVALLIWAAVALAGCDVATTTYDPTLVCDFDREDSGQAPPATYADCGTSYSDGTPCVICRNEMVYGAAWTYKRTGDLACLGDTTRTAGAPAVRGHSYVICLPATCDSGAAAGCQ